MYILVYAICFIGRTTSRCIDLCIFVVVPFVRVRSERGGQTRATRAPSETAGRNLGRHGGLHVTHAFRPDSRTASALCKGVVCKSRTLRVSRQQESLHTPSLSPLSLRARSLTPTHGFLTTSAPCANAAAAQGAVLGRRESHPERALELERRGPRAGGHRRTSIRCWGSVAPPAMLTPEVRPRTTQPAKLQIERTTAPKPLPPSANLKFGHNFVSPPPRARARRLWPMGDGTGC